MEKRLSYFLWTILCLATAGPLAVAQGNEGYEITIKVKDASAKELYLAHHFGEKQFIADTAVAQPAGTYVFKGEDPLKGGIYLVAMPPTNKYFELLIDPEESQHFSVSTDTLNYGQGMRIEGSEENKRFYSYIQYLNDKRAEGQSIQQLMQEPSASEEDMTQYEEQLQALSQQVAAYQEKVLTEAPNSLMTAVIKANKKVEVPEAPEGAGENFKLYYYREHYFDNINWGDSRLLRTPILESKIMDYLNRLHLKTPDSLIVGVDRILDLVYQSNNEKVKQFVVSRLLNEYAKSKLMGMDAVYVHIAENYYAKGRTPWVEEEQLNKIIDNARKLKPLLIGKKAPDLTLPKLDGQQVSLYGLDAEYTVLYFWDPDCGNCSKASAKLVQLYDKYQSHGVEIFGVCNKTYEELGKCVEKEKEKGMQWINTADPYGRGGAHSKYYVRSNPLIYLLSKEKVILYKRIDPDQLKEILDRELGLSTEKASEESSGK